ncbi:uncharacterized protein BKCO1_3000205 [Diplodia corticola]|uniref:Uncharacterized protein n=1 Tax=Diplodia corticola TaxID=236234 RepID=A0A1J9S283_9PEZI|nr:uncharacterized protein BKCO1_3000205 [Diplodia corticola]OJD39075.1 hypothetical protein BKCO1_3000205 [Diplodia corticola]
MPPPPPPPRPLPPYTPFRHLAASTRAHAHPTVYDSAVGYGAPRVYWSAAAATSTTSSTTTASATATTPTPDHHLLAKDPFYRSSNYRLDAVFEYESLIGGFLRFACGEEKNSAVAAASAGDDDDDDDGEGATERVWLRRGEEVEAGEEGRELVRRLRELFRWMEQGVCFRGSVGGTLEAEEVRGRVWLHGAVRGLKDKMWAGMPPMSVQRWERRGLSLLEYEYEALELLSKTLAVFEYLNDPSVQQAMRLAHNRITEHIERFAKGVNEKRRRTGQPTVPVLELWDEYTKAFFDDVAVRAHGWMIGRINAMREAQKNAFDIMKAQEPQLDAQNTKILGRLSRLVDLERDVDYNFRISRYGFTRTSSNASSGQTSSPSPEKFKAERLKMHDAAEAGLGIFADGITSMRHAMGVGPFPFQSEYYMVLNDQADANKAVRGKDLKKRTRLYGPPSQDPKPEPWVQQLTKRLQNPDDEIDGFGFVVYRWKEYDGVAWEKLEAAVTGDLMNWGEQMAGADNIKPKAKLQWIEMAGPDMDNYRTHFKSLRESGQLKPGMRSDVFLVIDPRAANAWFPRHPSAESALAYAERHLFRGHVGISTMSSTRSTALGAMPTDFEPWVLAVDADFPRPTALSRPPLYLGWVRVQSSLVFEELYGLAASGMPQLEELWKMAASHPCAVCTGVAVTEVEIRRFCEWTELRNKTLSWVLRRPDALFYGGR